MTQTRLGSYRGKVMSGGHCQNNFTLTSNGSCSKSVVRWSVFLTSKCKRERGRSRDRSKCCRIANVSNKRRSENITKTWVRDSDEFLSIHQGKITRMGWMNHPIRMRVLWRDTCSRHWNTGWTLKRKSMSMMVGTIPLCRSCP